MDGRNPKADDWIAGLGAWRDELAALCEILPDSPLVEGFKWHVPIYTHAGGNVVLIGGFKDRAHLGFFKGVLLTDPEGILQAPGENSRSARGVDFTDVAQITARRPVLRAYIDEAIANEQAGRTVDLPKDDLDHPAELLARLETDDALRAAFEALTPGRRRSWLLHFGQAVQPATRSARIDKAAPLILQGKGLGGR